MIEDFDATQDSFETRCIFCVTAIILGILTFVCWAVTTPSAHADYPPNQGHAFCENANAGPTSIGGNGVFLTDGNCTPIAPGTVAPNGNPTTISGTGQFYYVSTSTGNDNADGLSWATAWKSISKINSFRFPANSKIRFRGGEVFLGCLQADRTNFPSTSLTLPTVLGAEGTGQFTIVSTCPGPKSATVHINGLSNFTIQDAIIAGSVSAPTQYGVLIENSYGDLADTIVLLRTDISAHYTPFQTDYGSEVYINGLSGAASGAVSHVQVLNSKLHGQTPTSPDDNGITSNGNGQNILNSTYQGNEVFNIGGKPFGMGGVEGNGIVCNSTQNCLAQFNYVHDVGANPNTCGGPAGIWGYNSDRMTLQFNEVRDVKPVNPVNNPAGRPCDWDGFDFDGAVTNSVIQYNYAHNNYGGGIITCGFCATGGSWGQNTIRFNVTQDNDSSLDGYMGEIVLATKFSNQGTINVYGNTSWNSFGMAPLDLNQGTFAGGYVANNIFIQSGLDQYGLGELYSDNNVRTGGVTTINNLWWTVGAAAGHQTWVYGGAVYSSLAAWATGSSGAINVTGSLFADPKLLNGDAGGTCGTVTGPQPCPQAYTLQTGSPAVGAGLNLTQAPYNLVIGARDYFGNAVPNGTASGENMGAQN